MNLILSTCPQTPPSIKVSLRKGQEVVSTDEVSQLPSDNEIITVEKVNEVSNNLKEPIVNILPPKPNQVQHK